MFDIAWSEMLVIVVVALIVIGPKELPRLVREVGRWTAKARSMAREFQRSFDDMVRTLMVAGLHLEHDAAVAAVRAAQEVESRTNLVSQ